MQNRLDLFDVEYEKQAAAAAILDPGITLTCGDTRPEHFKNELYGAIWRGVRELVDAGTPCDVVTLSEHLRAHGVDVTLATLALLVADCISVAHGEIYAAKVREYAHRRQTERLAQRLVQIAYNTDGTYEVNLAELAQQVVAHTARARPHKGAKTSWTVAELYDADLPEPSWIVPDILPAGLSLLAGRPKVGKSWLALQIAHAVGTGGKVFDRDVARGAVLYLALEDGPRRLRNRLRRHVVPREADIRFETTWRDLKSGGLDDLQTAAGEYTLIIIDTLSRALGLADQSDLAQMTDVMGDLQQLALGRDVAILVIDHHRKPAGFVSDPVDDILGSTGKAAVADAVLGLFKTPGKPGATLKVTGRDLEDQELALFWDKPTCAWQLIGTVQEVELQSNRDKVLDALRDISPEAATLSELANMTGIRPNNLHPILADLVTSGMIERLPKRGREVPYRSIGLT